ncbi:MAG: cation:proton antiporter [Cyanobacteria bacterium P01_E01_bin.35]
MSQITILWIALPFLVGFVIYLLPKLSRLLALTIALITLGYAWQVFLLNTPLNIQLLDNFGITLVIDPLSGWFILTNALVTTAVIVYCWYQKTSGLHRFFYMQLVILHGSVNATFICADFISLYVALEVISIAAFLLIAYPRSDRSIWVGLRYLFVSNTAMLFYLIGAVLVYQANHSFEYAGLINAPIEAITLIILGLLAKGGIFVSGFWLPLTHSESETPVSAMLSGVVVKAGVFPLLRCALTLEEIDPVVRIFGVATALLGVGYAIFEQDTKRTLAFSTISQLGFILAAPVVGGFYALTHGLVKSALFLIAGNLPSRSFSVLREQGINTKIWLVLVIASLSICGFPLLSGFTAKILTSKNFLPWQGIFMNVATLGTVITFAKFIYLPHHQALSSSAITTAYPLSSLLSKEVPAITSEDKKAIRVERTVKKLSISPGFWGAMLILLGGLFVANGFRYEVYTLNNLVKPLLTVVLGWLAYLLLFEQLNLRLSRASEQFVHLIGGMSLVLILVFWLIKIQANVSINF